MRTIVGLSPSKKFFLLAAMMALKMVKNDKNDFYFILKTLFVLKISIFWPDFFGHVKKQLEDQFQNL